MQASFFINKKNKISELDENSAQINHHGDFDNREYLA